MKKINVTFILCFSVLILTALLLFFFKDSLFTASGSSEFDETIQEYAKKYDLDPALVKAVIRVESNFDPKAKSHANAYGLMQITEETLHWAMMHEGCTAFYGAEDLYDPDINVHYGCAILSRLLNEFKDLDTALAAYNAGRSNALKWLKDTRFSDDGDHLKATPYNETNRYMEKVRKYYEKYKKDKGE